MTAARFWFQIIAISAPALLAMGCGKNDPAATNKTAADALTSSGDNKDVDVGTALYKPADYVKTKPSQSSAVDPTVIGSCTVQYEERQQVAADVDGRIEVIATPLDKAPDGKFILSKKPDGTVAEYYDPAKTYPFILFHPRDKSRPSRRLAEGDEVQIGQILCMLDEQLVNNKLESAIEMGISADGLKAAADRGRKLTEEKLKITEMGVKNGTISYANLLEDQITLTRFEENLSQAQQTKTKATGDYKEAMTMLAKHSIRSSVNGIVRSIAKRPGEYVKAGDRIMEVQATDRVRLEGNLDVQYAAQVVRGQIVTVEPAVPSAPFKSHAWHRLEVTGVAVTAHKNQPMVVTTSADGSALVWDPSRDVAGVILNHPVAVRSVACSPVGPKHLAVTGGDDGRIRVWDLTDPKKAPESPIASPTEAHPASVQAIAFSPDGKFFASAGGREVFVWSAADGKKLYTLPVEHRDTVTSVSFTPQATLITAAKDRTLKIWKLGADKGACARTIEHRSGTVDVLGVSPDGGRVLFDQDKARIDLVSPADKQTVGQIQNATTTSTFGTFALFSPKFGTEDVFLATGGGEGDMRGTIQVWSAPPAGGRGSELARLLTPARVAVTCSAFSPDEANQFIAAGTATGTVHLWKRPATRNKCEGRVTYVDSTDTRYATVRVELDNTVLKLLDRSAASVIIGPAGQ